jgi:hypothetical protein
MNDKRHGLFTGLGGSARAFGAPPWAWDADGRDVPTRYIVEGDTIVQEVDHAGGDYAYPIVADPWMGNALISSWSWEGSSRLRVTPTQYSRGWTGNVWYQEVGRAGYAELKSKMSTANRSKLNKSGENQYICHVYYAPYKATWNLDLNVRDKGLPGFVLSACN